MGMRQRLGVACCLLGDPDLLILDEPMNGLDPAGMQEMRELIRSFVAEGRTVMLSSHLLDEIERTCDAVAIVDHGKVIRQGAISDLLSGTTLSLSIECSTPARARDALSALDLSRDAIDETDTGLRVGLAPGTSRDLIAEINRRLVESGVAVYRLEANQASLESWFLEVTSRLGESS